MKIRSIIYILTALLIICLNSPVPATAETVATSNDLRNLYIGDIIVLEIISQEHTAEQLTKLFNNFDIVEIETNLDGYTLSLRTMKIGEYRILLGDKEIIITVNSTLDDFHNEGIILGNMELVSLGIPLNWRMLLIITACIFCLSLGFVLYRIKRKTKTPSPYQVFLTSCGNLSSVDDDYFVKLTFYFKRYLENLFQSHIIDKTSVEITNELKSIPVLSNLFPIIHEWLTECDRLKFTGVNISSEMKLEHRDKLLDLVKNIELTNEAET